jgi:hypothetical protein
MAATSFVRAFFTFGKRSPADRMFAVRSPLEISLLVLRDQPISNGAYVLRRFEAWTR